MDIRTQAYSDTQSEQATVTAFLSKVYIWMTGGLTLTGIISWHISQSPDLLQTFILNRNVFMGLIIGELALVMFMSFMANKVSAFTAGAMFVAYSALNGVTLSVIFIAYTMQSVTQIFFLSAGMFAGMSLYGYATKKDLTSMGSFMIMGLWGIILASLVNFFFKSPLMSYAISFIAIFVFLGLTAYDTQKLKQIAMADSRIGDSEKPAIYGALALYLDFINLFLNLLNLLGKRR